ncbi:hypothetical protein D9758_013691 [Tetrapyrgos nigripes]|uniref:Translocation protein sec72 n=1 Tax=Tetrapyrgos nigripes TaxID=182062 RepID=A0A8H5CK83_9AGAR|nr:hypothetical protein D9758_013691 [Tetrapyrgos nigripes]
MSHSHTHAPGESHSHSHSHGPPQPQAQPQMMLPTPDPASQAIIEADFRPVSLIVAPEAYAVFCQDHKSEKCEICDQDYVGLNRLAKILATNPAIAAPPPPNVVSRNLSQAVNHTKEEGNTLYKQKKHPMAIARYTMAASIAVQRPPWETNQFMREELSTIISNRSAAYAESQDYISALADAETVIAVRRNWSKGHFRKAKALVGLGELQEAKEALQLGLAYEPTNAELSAFSAEVEKMIQNGDEKVKDEA